MEIKLSNGDRLTVPQGCKATVNGSEIIIEKEKQEFNDGDMLIHENGNMAILKGDFNDGYFSDYVSIEENELLVDCKHYWKLKSIGWRIATDDEKQYLFDKMKERGLRWNAENKQMEKIRWRAKKGDRYWKIPLSSFVVSEMQEDNDAFDQEAWKCGNYFKTQEQAERAAEAIKEVLRKFHEENDQHCGKISTITKIKL